MDIPLLEEALEFFGKTSVNFIQHENKEVVQDLEHRGFLQHNTWLIDDSLVTENLTNIRYDSHVYSYKVEGEDFKISEHYAIRKMHPKMNFYANWNAKRGLEVAQPNVYIRRNDLSGVTIRNVVLNASPAVQYNDEVGYFGYFIDPIKIIAQETGFNLEISKPPDNTWGSTLDNGTWVGMVGQLSRGEMDVSTSPLTIMLERSSVIDYSIPVRQVMITLTLMRSGGKKEINFGAYAHIFSYGSWLAAGLTGLVLSVYFYIIHLSKLEKFHKGNDSENFTLFNAMGLVYLAIIQLEYHFNRIKWSTRVAYVTTCLCALLIYAFYDAVLTSRMTVNPLTMPIRTFWDVIPNEYQLIVVKDSSVHDSLINSPKGSALHEIYQKTMVNNPRAFIPQDFDRAAYLLKNPKVAYFGHTESKSFTSETRLTSLKMPDALKAYIAFGLQKDSELRGFFNHHLLNMMQNGIKNKLYRNYYPHTTVHEIDEHDATPLGYDNLIFPILILSSGLIACLIVAILERLYFFASFRTLFR